MRTFAALLGTCLIFIVTFGAYYYPSQPGGLAFDGSKFPFSAFLLTCTLMLLGILFGSLFRRLGGPSRKIDVIAEFREVISSSSFIAALCISPFVFSGVYMVALQSPGDPSSYLLAFQNGFFCESIFRRMFPDDQPRVDQDRSGGAAQPFVSIPAAGQGGTAEVPPA
jgi:hypothetical protein